MKIQTINLMVLFAASIDVITWITHNNNCHYHMFASANTLQRACTNCLKNVAKVYCPTKSFENGKCEFKYDYTLNALFKDTTYDPKTCSFNMDDKTKQREQLKKMSCPTIDKCHVNNQKRIKKASHTEFAIYNLEKDNIFGNSEICNYVVEFPDDATYGDRLKLEFRRLSGATVYVGIGKEFDKWKDFYAYQFSNENTI